MKPAVTKHGPAATQSCLKTLAAPFRNGHACHARRGGRARERWEWRSCSSKAGNDCSLSIRNSLVLSRQVGRRGHNDHAPLANQNGLVSFGVSSRAAAEQCFFQRYAAQLCRCRNCHRLWLSCCRFVERRERGDSREPAGWPRSPHGGTGSCLPGRSRRRARAAPRAGGVDQPRGPGWAEQIRSRNRGTAAAALRRFGSTAAFRSGRPLILPGESADRARMRSSRTMST